MGPPGRIPWTAVDAYARTYGFRGDAYDDLVDIVMEVDTAYVEWLAAQKPPTDA
jgi:hypothetical protein